MRGFEKQYAQRNILNHETRINMPMEKITSEEHHNLQPSSNMTKASMMRWPGNIVRKIEKIRIIWSQKRERKKFLGRFKCG
jgi:hypothetical protein